MIYLPTWSSTLIASTLTLVVFIFINKENLIELWEDMTLKSKEEEYIEKYGKSGRVYALANKKKLQIEDIKIERDSKVRFFVPCKDTFVEGIFIGVDRDGLLYIRMDNEITEDSGDIIAYEARGLKKKHIVYVKSLEY